MHRDAMRKAIRNIMVIIDEDDKGPMSFVRSHLTFYAFFWRRSIHNQVVYPEWTCNETTCFVIFYSIK